MANMDKQQFLEKVINDVRALSVVDILNTRIKLIRMGGNYKALCPFHNDRTIGSFVASESKGIWKCFSCGEGGDGIKFIAKYDGINYVESAFNIALDFSLITSIEYDEYFTKRRYSKDQITKIEKTYTDLDRERLKSNIANEETLNNIFKIFINAIEKCYKDNDKYIGRLSKEHKKHLLEERELSEEDIENGMFFTFPDKRTKIWNIFKEELLKNKLSIEVLSTIPGFFKDKKGDYTFVGHKGIGIGIKNTDEKIIGIQVRHDKVDEGKNRYIWFSSDFANYKDDCSDGTSSGSPIDVVFPKSENFKTGNLFITEGRFKALKICEKFGAVAISVQGVCSWRNIINEIKKINESKKLEKLYDNSPLKKNLKFSTFKFNKSYISFDADMNYKNQVFEQASKLSEELRNQLSFITVYSLWNEEFGKGIDDVLIRCDKENISINEKMVSSCCEDWDKKHANLIIKIKEETDYEETKDIPMEVMQEYFSNILKPQIEIAIKDAENKRLEKKQNKKKNCDYLYDYRISV
ncbi:MAG: primase [Clostridiaceae bacterium]|jgi:hypothetical protein|nr:primase [Clostridiaceae bacterium]